MRSGDSTELYVVKKDQRAHHSGKASEMKWWGSPASLRNSAAALLYRSGLTHCKKMLSQNFAH